MHYYQLNIGDYKSHTNHLDLLEDLAYRRLLDLYYLHERPLNSGIASVARQINMREHEDKVQLILEEFFHMSEDGWINPRADREIKHYHSKIEQASRAGKASAERRINARSTDVQPNNKQETINNKQETKNTATVVAPPDGVSSEVWSEFVKQRKMKKAQITGLVLMGIQREADKAGFTLENALKEVVLRGWTSFKAEWVAEKPMIGNRKDVVFTTVPGSMERDPALVKLDEDRKKVAPPSPEILARLRAVKGA